MKKDYTLIYGWSGIAIGSFILGGIIKLPIWLGFLTLFSGIGILLKGVKK